MYLYMKKCTFLKDIFSTLCLGTNLHFIKIHVELKLMNSARAQTNDATFVLLKLFNDF